MEIHTIHEEHFSTVNIKILRIQDWSVSKYVSKDGVNDLKHLLVDCKIFKQLKSFFELYIIKNVSNIVMNEPDDSIYTLNRSDKLNRVQQMPIIDHHDDNGVASM